MKVKTYSYHDIKTGRRFEGTISEAVEYFNVCKSSLEKWKKSGRLERKLIGSKENDIMTNGEKISSPEIKRVLNREFILASFR
ncbi:hypothetical protein MK858_02425 [Streptococcus infantarius]|uniref:hypothetical protein n=1 Tax=Streptococcus infantarius TaxID=102684 RepID=UPI0022849546|nr:hypothetical protein [Streptococcus infantarius]MCY7237918.1 hypothetical protein [Streptococcus infantarius]